MKKKIYRFAFIFCITVVFLYGVVVSVSAKTSCNRTKTFTTVKVCSGDTLWKIASEYYTDDYKNMNEYIDEIMESNGMYTDKIISGQTIIVPYFR